jgi:hypothetical protein
MSQFEGVNDLTDDQPEGYKLIQSALEIVVDELRRHPEGLRNVEVGTSTGLFLPVTNHPGYITWTILRYLVEQKRVVKHGPIYRLKANAGGPNP